MQVTMLYIQHIYIQKMYSNLLQSRQLILSFTLLKTSFQSKHVLGENK